MGDFPSEEPSVILRRLSYRVAPFSLLRRLGHPSSQRPLALVRNWQGFLNALPGHVPGWEVPMAATAD